MQCLHQSGREVGVRHAVVCEKAPLRKCVGWQLNGEENAFQKHIVIKKPNLNGNVQKDMYGRQYRAVSFIKKAGARFAQLKKWEIKVKYIPLRKCTKLQRKEKANVFLRNILMLIPC